MGCNGDSERNIAGAVEISILAFVACRDAEYEIILRRFFNNIVIEIMVFAVVAVAAEAHAADLASMEICPFHTCGNTGIIAVAAFVEHPDAHDLDIGKGSVNDGAGAVGAVAVFIFGVIIIVDEIVAAGYEPAYQYGVVAVNTGINDGNGNGGNVCHVVACKVIDPGIEIPCIGIVCAPAPGHEVVAAAGLVIGTDIALDFNIAG